MGSARIKLTSDQKTLFSRNKGEPFLHRIVTYDEKWIVYDNRKRSSS